jgi:phage-related protein
VSPKDKPLAWLHREVKTPPFSAAARIEAGYLIRQLQKGELLSMPQSRPMPSIGAHCHELRVNDAGKTWRMIYRIDSDAIVIADVFAKKTEKTPDEVVRNSQKRLKDYDNACREAKKSRSQGMEGRKRKGLPRAH